MPTEPGVWEPGKPEPTAAPDVARLREFVRIIRATGGEQLTDALSATEIEANAPLMRLEASAWQVADELETAELEELIRFFTLAEMQLPGWDGGKDSPVVSLVQLLRRRDAFTPELRKWIKANSDNRFLPYGSAL
ncbi:MAG: hypothetical protein U5O39_09680 [Gammaproteobacteria bacterium]|nr:hypothetical protein [Gammaproteobacteria bacterium]